MAITRNFGPVHPVKLEMLEEPSSGMNFQAATMSSGFRLLNMTRNTIYVLTQDDVMYTIPSLRNTVKGSEPRPHVEICVEHVVTGQEAVGESLRKWNLATQDKIELSHSTKIMQREINTRIHANPRPSSLATAKGKRSYLLTETTIHEQGRVYVREANIVISFDPGIIADRHPNSVYSWNALDIRSKDEVQHGSGSAIVAVDNDRLYGSLFYFAHNKLFEVKTCQNDSRPSGVYYSELMNSESGPYFNQEFMTFDEAKERLGLYPNREAAMTNGNPEILHSNEEVRLKQELEELRHVNDRLKAEAERERIMHEKELVRIKHDTTVQRENVEVNSLARKTEYEEKKMERETEISELEAKHKRSEMKAKARHEKDKAKLEKANATIKTIETAGKAAVAVGVVASAVITVIGYMRKPKVTSDRPSILSAFQVLVEPSSGSYSHYSNPKKAKQATEGSISAKDYDEYRRALSELKILTEAKRIQEESGYPNPHPELAEREDWDIENCHRIIDRIAKKYPNLFAAN